MKFRYGFLLLFSLSLPFAVAAQGVGIGVATPAASAALDVTSTTKGLVLPRMTFAQRAAIATPSQGLLVYQTNGTPGLYYYVGNSWVNVLNGIIPDASGNSGPNPTVRVTTLAGSGIAGAANGMGTAAQFRNPNGVAVDGSGNVYVADQVNNCIRTIVVATGAVSTLAGSISGFADGTGTAAQFNSPTGVAVDGSGNLYVADRSNQRIRKIVLATGEVSTLAGSGTAGFVNGAATAAQFNSPAGVAIDGSGNLYVADFSNHSIRQIVVATGVVSTLAGTGTAGFVNGAAAIARFNYPNGIAVDGSGTNVYVADTFNHRIRVVK